MARDQDDASGSFIGGILLVAGSCIGAAMLGLPMLTGQAGFVPSVGMLILSWAFMAATGLLTLEVNLWFSKPVSFVSMAETTLGQAGKWAAWTFFLILFYSLMVAYVVGSGELGVEVAEDLFGFALPPWVGSTFFVGLFGFIIYRGIGAVDNFNRLLMLGLLLSYGLMIFLGIPHLKLDLVQRKEWFSSYLALPAMIVSFGFHNLIPSLKGYLAGNRRRLIAIVVMGSFIPLFMYFAWELLILGVVPYEVIGNFSSAMDQGDTATHLLRQQIGVSWIVQVADAFAFFAIVTSLLGVALSFVDFLADGLAIKKDKRGRFNLCFLVLVPSYLVAVLYPRIFLMALSYAGAFGAATLFGIMPVLMVWKGRYTLGHREGFILPGGKPVLTGVFLLAMAIIAIGCALKL